MNNKNRMHNLDLKIEVSPSFSNGVALRSVSILCEELPDLENTSLDSYSPQLTYDTFQTLGNKQGENCYTFSWEKAVEINQIVMTMGFPFTDGGWWTSLILEYKKNRDDSWNAIPQTQFSPAYNFMNTSYGRFPFERYKINFSELKVAAFRLIGIGGGFSSFTSLSCIEAFLVDNMEEEKIKGRNYPMPKLYNLISPDKIWHLGSCLYVATGIFLATAHLQYYLNAESYKEFNSIYELQYKTPPVWRLLKDKEHWENYSEISETESIITETSFHELFAQISGPILLEGNSLGTILTNPPILLEYNDLKQHKLLAEEYGIDWEVYIMAMNNMICMSIKKVDGIANLILFIIHEIIHQVQYAQILNRKELESRPDKRNLIQDALTIMEQDLESGIYINSILDKLHVSYHQLSAAFKQSYGTTPNKILCELKMDRAKKYLEDDRLRIIDIAGTLGYTENHFIRTFKKKMGKTPGEYRKSIMHKC